MYAPYKLFALVQAAKQFGLPPETVLKGTSLTEEALQDGRTQSTVEQYLTASTNVIGRCDDPMLPLTVGRSLHLSAYGLYGFALLCSPTVRTGFEMAVRYHRLATPIFSIRWEIENGEFVWTFPNEALSGYSRPLRRFLTLQQLAQHITHVQDIARSDRRPLWMEVALDPPTSALLFDAEFGCPVHFGAPMTRIVYDMTILDDRPPLTNPVTHALLRESCESLIGSGADRGGLAGHVARIVMEALAPFPSMEDVAGKMALTPRTLRRRLADEGTSYSEILDQVRNDLARKYLESNTFTVDDIADLLGFTDAANFRSSFKRWNGVTPSEYRASIPKAAQERSVAALG
jgi:AraC-like DNA-binding protein